MHRAVGGLFALLLLSSCAPMDVTELQQDLAAAAQAQLKKTLAGHLTERLGTGIDMVVAGLAEPGGYLDNPLVRILLPPPIGLALDVVRDLNADPQAAILQTVMNRAAEQAIPGAGPILRSALSRITPDEAQRLLEGDATAVTDYLRARTEEALQMQLAPAIALTLAGSAAEQTYSDLVETYASRQALPEPGGSIAPVTVPDIEGYVTDQAIQGLFRVLGARERRIREDLDQAVGGVLNGIRSTPAARTPAEGR